MSLLVEICRNYNSCKHLHSRLPESKGEDNISYRNNQAEDTNVQQQQKLEKYRRASSIWSHARKPTMSSMMHREPLRKMSAVLTPARKPSVSMYHGYMVR